MSHRQSYHTHRFFLKFLRKELLKATVNPKNNLAHCFCCGENTNNIDLMMPQGHDFLTAVSILKNWLNQYRHDLGLPEQSTTSRSTQDE